VLYAEVAELGQIRPSPDSYAQNRSRRVVL
jgi:hypothetical protein